MKVTKYEQNSNKRVTKEGLVTIQLLFSYLRVTKYKYNDINELSMLFRYLVTIVGVLGLNWEKIGFICKIQVKKE